MSIINSSYFIGERNIPNTNASDVGSLLANMLNIYEKKWLVAALGYDLFVAFKAALLNGDPLAQRYWDILFGADFTGLDGLPTRWDGLVAKTDENALTMDISIDGNTITLDVADVPTSAEPKSPLADYVYFYWLRKKNSQTADVGEVRSDDQNAQVISPRYKLTYAWNDMVDKTCKLHEMMVVNYAVYPEYQRVTGTDDNLELRTKLNPYF